MTIKIISNKFVQILKLESMIYKNQTENKKTQKFQTGGTVPQNEGTPEGGEGQASQGQTDPIAELVNMAQKALKSQDCQAAMAVCQGFMMLVSQSSQGEQAPPPPTGEPVYKKGGVLLRRQ